MITKHNSVPTARFRGYRSICSARRTRQKGKRDMRTDMRPPHIAQGEVLDLEESFDSLWIPAPFSLRDLI